MSIRARILSRIAKILNRYDAAYTRWGDRSWINHVVQDARLDADKFTREELTRKVRSFEANNWLCNRLADLFEQYTVGPSGLQFVCASSNAEWNQRAQEWWDQWCKFPDVASRANFGTLQSLAARTWFVDGEAWFWLTVGDSGRPRVQSHRVKTPPDKQREEGKTIIDGVQVDMSAGGRPLGYWLRDAFDDTKFAKEWIPADSFVHIYEPSRPGQFRGLTFFYPVLNLLHDLDDLQMLEMRAAKDQASVTKVVKNAAGEAQDAGVARRLAFATSTTNTAGQAVTQNRYDYFRSILGGETAYLKPDEDLQMIQPTRPSVVSQQYWDYLTGAICAGVGISPMLVRPFSMQGTVVRSDLDTAATYFRSRSEVIGSHLIRIFEYVMGWACRYDKALAGAPDDWWRVSIRPPRSVNVDVGRNSQATINELSAGYRTFEGVCLEGGDDYRKVLEQRAREAKLVRDLAIKYGVDPAEISTVQADKVERISAESARKEDEMDVVPPDTKPKDPKE
jgi:capsid protein